MTCSLHTAWVKIIDIFDSLSHNFDSMSTKTIGWWELYHSNPAAKFKRNPLRNVPYSLNKEISVDKDADDDADSANGSAWSTVIPTLIQGYN